MKNKYTMIITIFLICLSFSANAYSDDQLEKLDNLVYQNNSTLKSIREDIKQTIYTVKSGRGERNLPELKFYTYKLKPKENFWVVMSKCSLDMDTLMSVNNLTSPFQVVPGTVLYIPNMRGVIVPGENLKAVYNVIAAEKINIRYVKAVNKSDTLDKKFLFIPCGKISTIERSLFLGTAFFSPLQYGKATSGFGTRRNPFNDRRMEFHKGIDLGCHSGTKVHAARSGEVVFSGYEEGYGNLVIVEHEFGYRSYYGHLSKRLVKAGQKVKPGEIIALSGNTGRSTGPHLHFEIRKNGRALNPLTFLKKSV
ncbi:MAG TPA: LysM peptidoglycan-binding domain-containing M23 family metallopeptidase [Spirochaetota bacterium]|nr:LysM peptidoglycan-binding domain-containing M23 family metallopeptidase [Spirochaetota bacterium]HPS86545.1 LysM peptidoglycan-binding domain-containing M23 family metallopeptidase [Spirochaetota bacterium]